MVVFRNWLDGSCWCFFGPEALAQGLIKQPFSCYHCRITRDPIPIVLAATLGVSRSYPSIFLGRQRAKSRMQRNQLRITPATEEPQQSFTFSSMPLTLLSVFIFFPMPRRLVTPALPLRFPSEVVHYKETPQIFIEGLRKDDPELFH